jgi:hypothetical protein
MRLTGKTITVLLAMIFTMAPMATTQQQPAPEMSYRQAQRAIMKAMPYGHVKMAGTAMGVPPRLDIDNVRLTQGALEFDGKGVARDVGKDVHFTIPLKELHKVTATCDGMSCSVVEEHSKSSKNIWCCFLTNYKTDKNKWARLDFWKDCSQAQNHDACMSINPGTQFVAALNSLHSYALGPTLPPDEEFHKQATAWRALAIKPVLPDAVRVRRMMAEDAIKNKKPEDALMFYEQALEAYPTWPEGWFNAALVAGELGRYDDAVDDMQNYLELVPDAKDAQSARDQLEIWKIKAQEKK